MTSDPAPNQQPSMHLSAIKIRNFRSCRDTDIKLKPTLTLLVGENNAGKSNVIDAIRLSTSPLSGRRSRFFEVEDGSHGAVSHPIEIENTYSGLTDFQRGQYLTALNLAENTLTYTTRFTPAPPGKKRGKIEYLAGAVRGPDIEPEKRNEINHVYLEPLRNAQRELDSGSGQRLSMIIRYLTTDADQEDFVATANASLRELEDHKVLQETTTTLQGHLTDLTSPIRKQNVGLSFADYKLHRLARNLRLKMSEYDIDLADIAESGLGYANLLYIATLILELRNAEESELTLFLVEEPEAHLHPQLQEVLLAYLLEQAERSIRDDSTQRSGRIQIIATTHSPNLASAVGIENTVVLRSVEAAAPTAGVESKATTDAKVTQAQTEAAPESKSDAEDASLQAEERAPRRVSNTAALCLADLALTAQEARKINQYLDVTRSELLFARRIVLLEGIAEAVLLPVLADRCVLKGDDAPTRAKRRSVRAASIIAVGSVDFAPYVRLLVQKVNGIRLVDRLVIVTDSDPELSSTAPEGDAADLEESGSTVALDDEIDPDGAEDSEAEEEEVAINRGSKLRDLAAELDSTDAVTVVEAIYTLEADLMLPVHANAAILKKAFLAQKPRSGKAWRELVEADNPAEAMYRKLRASKKFLAKGQYAHDIATLLLTEAHEFQCPAYLEQAIIGAASE